MMCDVGFMIYRLSKVYSYCIWIPGKKLTCNHQEKEEKAFIV